MLKNALKIKNSERKFTAAAIRTSAYLNEPHNVSGSSCFRIATRSMMNAINPQIIVIA